MKKQSLIIGSVILVVLTVISRFLGIFIRIPLDYMVGTKGMGLYFLPYPLYDTLMALSSVGLSVALSKLISEKLAVGDKLEAYRSFKIALLIFGIFGAVLSMGIGLFARQIVEVLQWPADTVYALWGLSLAPVFVTAMSAMRGLFQGHQNMLPTGISLILEQFGRVIFGLGLAWYLLNKTGNIGLSVGGATFGATAGAVLGLAYLGYSWYANRKAIRPNAGSGKVSMDMKAVSERGRTLLAWMIPVTICSLVNSVAATIDSASLPILLNGLHMSPTSILDTIGALGRVNTLINVPIVISASITANLVPLIASAYTKGDLQTAGNSVERGMKLAMILTAPCVAGLVAFSGAIIALIYSGSQGGDYLQIYALMLFFSILSNLLLNISIALGKPVIPVVTMGIGIVLKCVLNVYFVSTLGMGVIGAAISSIVAYFVIFAINLYYIKKTFGIHMDAKSVYVKPIVGALAMLAVCESVFWVATHAMKEGRLTTLLVLATGSVAYPLALICLKCLNPNELAELPGGSRIVKLLNRSQKAEMS